MSELQAETGDNGITLDNDHIEGEEIETPTETAESGADLATATEDKQDKSQDSKAQEMAQKAINKQHAKYREEERKRVAAENETKELKERLDKLEAENGEIIIPPVPDPYDEDFETQLATREEAIKQQAIQGAKQNSILEQQTANADAAKKADEERFQETVKGYNAQTIKLGLSADEIRVAGDIVVSNGIDGQVAEFILSDEDGPLITKYLAANPIIQDELRGLTTIQAAMKINSEIRSAASAMKPQASTAPDPAEILSGKGASETVNPISAGATFE